LLGATARSFFRQGVTRAGSLNDLDGILLGTPTTPDLLDDLFQRLRLFHHRLPRKVQVPELTRACVPHNIKPGEIPAMRTAPAVIGIRD
jgi:hypothetical protein